MSENIRAVLAIEGMTCNMCVTHIREALLQVEGVITAKLLLNKAQAIVEFSPKETTITSIKAAVEKSGYAVRSVTEGIEEPKTKKAWSIPILVGLLLVAGYLLVSASGVFQFLPAIDSTFTLSMLFIAGLFTSLHCVAMCGGIALTGSLGPTTEKSKTGFWARLLPALLYNTGRIISYTVLGAIAGAIGSVLTFSPLTRGLLLGLAGVFMILAALSQFGILSLPSITKNLIPQRVRDFFAPAKKAMQKGGSLTVGLLNGLMPCGPLQTMQIYALGTGSALVGALSMLVFAAGTIPLMIIFGLVAASMPKKLRPALVKASAVLVLFLGIITLFRAGTVSGFSFMFPGGTAKVSTETSIASKDQDAFPGTLVKNPYDTIITGNLQKITTVFTDGDYKAFTAAAGIPLEWTIRIAKEDLNGCNNTLIIPQYGIQKKLKPGDNIITFTPKKTGIIPYSCWMGMIKSKITVVDAGNTSGQKLQNNPSIDNEEQGSLTAELPTSGCCQ